MTGIFIAFLALAAPCPASCAEMVVSAAASLTNAFTEMKKAFEQEHPSLIVHTNFAASTPLLKQMEEGAPVDVFASADQVTMDRAVAAKVVDPATRKNMARNDLVLIVPKNAPRPSKLEDLANMQRVALGSPDSVPAGRYAKASLTNAGLWHKLENRHIYGANVRQVLDYVARGEVDAGIVYRTDALQQKDKVDIALIPGGHDPVVYPAAVAITGKNAEAGKEFLDFVLSPRGQELLAKYGFSKP